MRTMRQIFEAVELDPVVEKWKKGEPVPEGYKVVFGHLAKVISGRPHIQDKRTGKWAMLSTPLPRKKSAKAAGGAQAPAKGAPENVGQKLKRGLESYQRSQSRFGIVGHREITDKYPRKEPMDAMIKTWIKDAKWKPGATEGDMNKHLDRLVEMGKKHGLFRGGDDEMWDWAYVGADMEGRNEDELAQMAADRAGLGHWSDLEGVKKK